MEYCSQSLRNILQIKPRVFGRQLGDSMNSYEYFISCEIFRELLQCVQYSHELSPQIIHRDLKPENILISYDPKHNRFVKLCDFGLATIHDKDANSYTETHLLYQKVHKLQNLLLLMMSSPVKP
ncbi:unnamed protein product [Oppiella nova]|uniref:Protein kinase domain-containing protein n=1 Tax=Oppiella nova TaxID=334625 RepID=A0A7R9MPN4_9ACAR|nr:unnamed protein product [Oppiella nova]CAG2180901.1 unnamed protein product [Oppiella nova]